jgi:nucleoside-diphosphate-sugar epimerase
LERLAVNVAVLGASGRVGRLVVLETVRRGYDVACQGRSSARLSQFKPAAIVFAFDPCDERGLEGFLAGADVAVMALGASGRGPTTLFSDTTRILLKVMRRQRVDRLVVITGVGAGATRGHGGFLYDRIIYPCSRPTATGTRNGRSVCSKSRTWSGSRCERRLFPTVRQQVNSRCI